MKLIAGVLVGAGLVLASWAAWRLSTDAMAMAIGMVLGVVSVLPAIVLVLHVANRNDPAIDDDTVHYSWLAGSDRIRLRGGGLDGMWRRDDGHAIVQQPPQVIVYHPQQQPQQQLERRFAVRWESEAR